GRRWPGHHRCSRAGVARHAGYQRSPYRYLLLWRMNSNGETVIEVTDLGRKCGDRAVINDISFTIQRGETIVIMGASGCGKSTLLRHIIGSMHPTSGSVKIFGEEITNMKIGRAH